MVFYNIYDGHCVLSAMCDQIMQGFDSKTTQLRVGCHYLSKYLHLFLQHGDEKYRRLIKNLGSLNGTIAFQSFVLKHDFLPFDPTYRVDGTMTYRLTEHLNNINVLEILIRYCLTGIMKDDHAIALKEKPNIDKIGFQLPILLTRRRVSKVVVWRISKLWIACFSYILE